MPPVTVSLAATNVGAYRDLAKRLRKAGKKDLKAKLRKQITEAGRPVLDEVKAAVRDLPVTSRGGGGKRRQQFNAFRAEEAARRAGKDTGAAIGRGLRKAHGLRASIASATKLQITAKGVRFVVQSAALPPSQRTLPRHLDSAKGWRHPVFGDREVWVEQKGRPYFGATIKKRAPAFRRAIVQAMNEISNELDK